MKKKEYVAPTSKVVQLEVKFTFMEMSEPLTTTTLRYHGDDNGDGEGD